MISGMTPGTDTVVPLDLDSEIARAYREGQKDNWLVNYFPYPEFPEVISDQTHRLIEQASSAALKVIKQVSNLTMTGDLDIDGTPLLELLDIPPHCRYWIEKFYKPNDDLFWGRPDFHITNGKPQLLESNFASAAGYQQQVAGLCQYYSDHPQLFESVGSGTMRFLDPMAPLNAAFSERVKEGERVLIPDVFESYRHAHKDIKPYGGMVSWFNLNGDRAFRSAFIHQLSIRRDGVFLGDERMDHVFMSYYNPHVFGHFGDFLPFWDLYQEGKINIIDSMNEVLWSSKLLLAFISEFIHDLGFDVATRTTFESSVPWTRIMRPGLTRYQGEMVNLTRLARQHKERFVLKLAQSAEGKQVYVGKHVPQDAWEATVEQAAADRRWILQDYVEPDHSEMLLPSDGPCDDSYDQLEASMTLSPFMRGANIVGYLTRYYRLGTRENKCNSASVTRFPHLGTTGIVAPT